jgi:hypothetical protein
MKRKGRKTMIERPMAAARQHIRALSDGTQNIAACQRHG